VVIRADLSQEKRKKSETERFRVAVTLDTFGAEKFIQALLLQESGEVLYFKSQGNLVFQPKSCRGLKELSFKNTASKYHQRREDPNK
jgi:hypothetical protein